MHIGLINALRLPVFCVSVSVLFERIGAFIESDYFDIACRHCRSAMVPALRRLSVLRGFVGQVARGVVLC